MRWLLIWLGWSWVGVAHADAANALLARVENDLARGHIARAEQRLAVGLAQNPRSTALMLRYLQLAMPCAEQNVPERRKAELALQRLARASALPGDASRVPDAEAERRIMLHAAYAEALLGRFDDSLGRLQGAVQRQDAESVACARAIAAHALTEERLDTAREALQVASEAMPQDAVLGAELARVWLARGRVDLALPLLAARFALASQDLSARSELAYALAADGRPAEALSLLGAAREACEADATCALLAARCALEADRYEEAHAYLRARLARTPDDLDALFALGDVHARTGEHAAARETYQRVLTLRPDSIRATQALRALTHEAP